MRKITEISINKNEKNVTMFLYYNNDICDYSFNNYSSVEEALDSVRSIVDPYFPVVASQYRLVEIKGGKIMSDGIFNL